MHDEVNDAEPAPPRQPEWAFDPADRITRQREASFQKHLDQTIPYFAKFEENGDVPWFNDPEKLAGLGIESAGVEARREFWFRRYTRPEPPEHLLIDPRRPQAFVAGPVGHSEPLSPMTPIMPKGTAA